MRFSMCRGLCLALGLLFVCPGWVHAQSGAVRYNFTVINTWSEATHPGVFPANSRPHFSSMGFLAHNAQAPVWKLGQLASPATIQMAETGDLIKFQQDASAEIAAGTVSWTWFNFSTNPGISWTVGLLDLTDAHPLLTIESMIGPSPDWFIGVSGLDLREEGIWRNKVVVDLFAYDAGTRSAQAFELFGPMTHPQAPISLVDNVLLPGNISLGTFTFELTTPFLDGDLNHDGLVDILDLNRVLANWNQVVPVGNQVQGDADGNGLVDILDLNQVLGNWNASAPPASQIPEPGSASLLVCGAAALLRRRG